MSEKWLLKDSPPWSHFNNSNMAAVRNFEVNTTMSAINVGSLNLLRCAVECEITTLRLQKIYIQLSIWWR